MADEKYPALKALKEAETSLRRGGAKTDYYLKRNHTYDTLVQNAAKEQAALGEEEQKKYTQEMKRTIDAVRQMRENHYQAPDKALAHSPAVSEDKLKLSTAVKEALAKQKARFQGALEARQDRFNKRIGAMRAFNFDNIAIASKGGALTAGGSGAMIAADLHDYANDIRHKAGLVPSSIFTSPTPAPTMLAQRGVQPASGAGQPISGGDPEKNARRAHEAENFVQETRIRQHTEWIDARAKMEMPTDKDEQRRYAESLAKHVRDLQERFGGEIGRMQKGDSDIGAEGLRQVSASLHELKDKVREDAYAASGSNKRLLNEQLKRMTELTNRYDGLVAGDQIAQWRKDAQQEKAETLAQKSPTYKQFADADAKLAGIEKEMKGLQRDKEVREKALKDPQHSFRRHRFERNGAFHARVEARKVTFNTELPAINDQIDSLKMRHARVSSERREALAAWESEKETATEVAKTGIERKQRLQQLADSPEFARRQDANEAAMRNARETSHDLFLEGPVAERNANLKEARLDTVFRSVDARALHDRKSHVEANELASTAVRLANRVYNATYEFELVSKNTQRAGEAAFNAMEKAAQSPDQLHVAAQRAETTLQKTKATMLAEIRAGRDEMKMPKDTSLTMTTPLVELKKNAAALGDRQKVLTALQDAAVKEARIRQGVAPSDETKIRDGVLINHKESALTTLRAQLAEQTAYNQTLTELRTEATRDLALTRADASKPVLRDTVTDKLTEAVESREKTKNPLSTLREKLAEFKLKNKKGIKREEANLAAKVAKLDANHDGKIDEKEVKVIDKDGKNGINAQEFADWAGSQNYAMAARDLSQPDKLKLGDIAHNLTAFLQKHNMDGHLVASNGPAGGAQTVGSGQPLAAKSVAPRTS